MASFVVRKDEMWAMTDCQDEVSESVAQTNESLKSIERTMTDCQDEVSEFQATAN